jgi:hypothetical protein
MRFCLGVLFSVLGLQMSLIFWFQVLDQNFIFDPGECYAIGYCTTFPQPLSETEITFFLRLADIATLVTSVWMCT